MLTCPYCQTENTNQVTQCVTCGSSLGSDVLPIGTLLFGNTLEVQSVLGRGGFGIVYKALHLEKQKYVAIKELFPEGLATRGYNKQVSPSSQSEMQNAIARTSREAQMLRKLKHPSATKLFAYWEENSTAYMALELLEGQTLESRIQNKQLLTAEEAKQALLTILEVLEELHSHGFLHRDIKPANIMFTPNKVELIDFGSLTEFRKGERTKVSSRIATPEYAPLEQFGSEVTLSPATDLYALAATFCEAMTGSRVPSALDRANGVSLEPSMIVVRRVSRELADILEKALELRIELRFANTARIIELLNYSFKPVAVIQPVNQVSMTHSNPKRLTNFFSVSNVILVCLLGIVSVVTCSVLYFGFVMLQENVPIASNPSQSIPNQPVFPSSSVSSKKEKISSFFQTYGKIVNLQTHEGSSDIFIYTYQNNKFNLLKFNLLSNDVRSISQITVTESKELRRAIAFRYIGTSNIHFVKNNIYLIHPNGVLEYFNKNFEPEKKFFLDVAPTSFVVSENESELFIASYQPHQEKYSDTRIYKFDLKKQVLSILIKKSLNFPSSLLTFNNDLLMLYIDTPPDRLDAEIYNYSDKKVIKSILVKEGIGSSHYFTVKNGDYIFIYGIVYGQKPEGYLVSLKYTKNKTFQLIWRKKLTGFVGCNLALSSDKKNLIFPVRSKGLEIRDAETGELKKNILLPDLYLPDALNRNACPMSVDKKDSVFVAFSSNGFYRIQNGI